MNLEELKHEMDYQWRVQESKSWGTIVVPYVDARDVTDRLDKVCGPENWQADYKAVKNSLFCGIGIRSGKEWVWKWDAGAESNIEKEKGEASDAFKRAAVKWGVGRFLYDLKTYKLQTAVITKDGKERLYPKNMTTGQPIYDKQELSDYVNALRSGNTVEPEKPWLNENTDAFREAELYLREKKVTVEKIQKKYRMKNETKAKLQAFYTEGMVGKRVTVNTDEKPLQVDSDTGEIIEDLINA